MQFSIVLLISASQCDHKMQNEVKNQNPIQCEHTSFEIVSRERKPVRIVRQSSDFDSFEFDSVNSGRKEDLDLTVLKLLDSKEILKFIV